MKKSMFRSLGLLAVLVSGCAAHLSEAPTSISALRAEAAASPRDPKAQQQVALAEIFADHGDPKSIEPALARAFALTPNDVRLLFAAGIAADAHGHPSQALDYYLRALALAPSSKDPVAPHIAELSVHAIGGLKGSVAGFNDKVRQPLEQLLAAKSLPLPARHNTGVLLMQLAYQRGDRDAAQRIATSIGCATQFRAIGPFGPRDLLSFDTQQPVKPGQPLAAQYDLGPNRGWQNTRDLGARGCSVNLGGGPIANGGTTYAQSYAEIAEPGEYVMRFETPNSSEVFLDGKSIARIDRRVSVEPDVLFFPLTLSQGRHEITVKISTRHPNPALSIALSKEPPNAIQAIALPFDAQSQEGFARYLRAATAAARDDVLGARQVMTDIDVHHPSAAVLLSLRASLLLSDPLQPADNREDDARNLLLAALQRDPNLWSAQIQLAGMTAGNGREKEAITALRNAFSHWPEVPAIGVTLASLLRDQHWEHEADAVVAKLRKLVPDACAPMSAELDSLRARDRESDANKLAEQVEQCDAQANARYASLLRQRRWAEAQVELNRLASLEPPQSRYPWLLARLELAKNRGDQAEIDKNIAALRAEFPRSSTGALEQVDRLAGQGNEKAALATLQQLLKSQPESMAELNRLVPVLGGEHIMAPYRVDGLAKIKAFEASGRTYDGPQVLVFDYMAMRIFDDGSSIELVHSIQKAQSDEAVNDLGEVKVPDGAHILTLRLIKPDGTRLEPDEIEGKDEISLPTVVPGDYVEFEYIRYAGASEAFPGGYSGDRFYFESFEIPFDHSQMIVVVPKDMPIEIDPRGNAPKKIETISGNDRVLDFHVDQSKPLKQEPASVSAKEFLPSIRIGLKANWESFVDSIRDVLSDRDLYDPELASLVQQIVGEADPGDYRLRAERIYSWVLEHIDNNDDLFSQAAVMLRARAGNRARVLHYMLSLAGVPSRLALVRAASSDLTPTNMADGDTYEHLLVTYEDVKGPVWLFTVERYAPFGYIPPLLRGQPALTLAAGAQKTRVPAGSVDADLRQLVFDVTLNKDGSAHVDAVETLRGLGAVTWRSQLEAIPAPELNQKFEEEYAGRLMPGAQLKSLYITGKEQQADSIQLQYGFEVSQLGRKVGNAYAIPAILETNLSQSFATMAARTTDELVPSPMKVQITVRIHLPAGASRPAVPQPVKLQAALAGKPKFTMNARIEDSTVIIEKTLDLPIMRVPQGQYAAFAGFCRAVDVAEAKEMVVRLP